MVISVAKKMIGSVLKYLTEVNIRDHWTWCTDALYPFWLKSEWQHYISVLSWCTQPLTLLSHESRKWMHNLGCYLPVIQVSLPERIGKFAMAPVPLPNYSLKMWHITVWLFKSSCLQSWSHHTLFVAALVLHCLFFFPFLHGKFVNVAFLLDIVCSRHKTFRSCLIRALHQLSWGQIF